MSAILDDIRGAFGLLTIVPVSTASSSAPGRAFAWFPAVGLVIGGTLALVSLLPVDSRAKSFLVLSCWVLLSGGLHLDGWADACDGLLASAAPTRRLEIMKDPSAGTFAVVGLVLLLLGKWIALRNVPSAWLVAPAVAGRWALVLAASWFPLARQSGLAVAFREGLGIRQFAIAALSVLGLFAVYWLNSAIVPALALFSAPAVALLFGRFATARLGGGITGDVYGAICELTELVCLWSLGTWIGG